MGKGFWEAKKIANPEYEDDDQLYKYDDFGFLGFDVWQVKGGTIFDNIIITDDVAEADKFAEKWKALSDVEKQGKEKADESQNEAFEKFKKARAARDAAAKKEKKDRGEDVEEDEDNTDDKKKSKAASKAKDEEL